MSSILQDYLFSFRKGLLWGQWNADGRAVAKCDFDLRYAFLAGGTDGSTDHANVFSESYARGHPFKS